MSGCVFYMTGGGVYLDSDIEVLKNFDPLLKNKAFTGFEAPGRIAAWIFGSEKGNPLFKEFLDYYEGKHFIIGNGVYDTTPNPDIITPILKKYGLTSENKIQNLGRITVYPIDYFCPFVPYIEGHNFFTENTMANHHFNGAWLKASNEREALYRKHLAAYRKIFGKDLGKLFAMIRHAGLFKSLAFAVQKLIKRFRK